MSWTQPVAPSMLPVNDYALGPAIMKVLREAEKRGFVIDLHFGVYGRVACWPHTYPDCSISFANLESLPYAVVELGRRQDAAKTRGYW